MELFNELTDEYRSSLWRIYKGQRFCRESEEEYISVEWKNLVYVYQSILLFAILKILWIIYPGGRQMPPGYAPGSSHISGSHILMWIGIINKIFV